MKVPTRPHTLYIPDHLWDAAVEHAKGASAASVVVEALRIHLDTGRPVTIVTSSQAEAQRQHDKQMDTPIAVAPTERPVAQPPEVRSSVVSNRTSATTVDIPTSLNESATIYHDPLVSHPGERPTPWEQKYGPKKEKRRR